MDSISKTTALSRRTFLATTSAAMVGAAWGGLVLRTEAAQRHPQRGGVLQYGPSGDMSGLDAHSHNQNHVVHPTTVMYTGLTDLDFQGNTFRYDPDDYFARNLHSKSDYSQTLSGWQNAPYDGLVEEAKRTLNPARRKELYTAAWNIVNIELPFFYLHEVVYISAADKKLRGYLPSKTGALHYHGGGLRTAYMAS